MKKHFYLICLLLLSPLLSLSQYDILVWADEFNYTGLPDSTKWSYDVGGHGWGNQELQYYTNKRSENARVENGKLIIEARKESYEGNDYTSARLVTRNKGDWAYGRIEVRAKLPAGTGTWPAIWMLPTEWIYGNGDWPDVGEIDIMEHVGHREGYIHGTIHTHDFNHMDGTQQGDEIFIGDAVDTFHVYAIEWTENKIEWYVDNIKYFTFNNNGDGWSAWPFDHPFHLIMNIAVGGTWGGEQGVDDSIFPQKMELDYVRVYKTSNQLGGLINGPGELVPSAGDVKFSPKILNGSNYQWTIPNDANITEQDTAGNLSVNWGCQGGDVILSTELNENTYTDTLAVSKKDIRIQGDYFWNNENTSLNFFLDSMHSTNYQWTVPDGSTIVSGQGTNSLVVNWGQSTDTIGIHIENACLSKNFERKILSPNAQHPYPDPFAPHQIPGTIFSVNYDYGGEGLAYHDMESTNQGNGIRQENGVDTEYKEPDGNVGWFEKDEWLEYTIEIKETTWVKANFRVASLGGGGPLRILMNEEIKLDEVQIPDTEGWDNFISHEMGTFMVTPQDTLMRIVALGSGSNLGNMQFDEVEVTGIKETKEFNKVEIFPNPFHSHLNIQSKNKMISLEVWNIQGTKIKEIKFSNGINNYRMNMAGLSDGIFLIKIGTTKNQIINKRIVKI